jgi:3-oxoacyl-[acyl-carrier-protein] synthase-3
VTQTPDYLTPATSGILQDKLKLRKNIIVYDINLGCSGYTHGLIAISSIMKSLNLKKGLLAVGDVTSKLVNNKDNVSNLLFGDAGSVTAIENKTKSKEKMFFDYYSDGSGFKDIIVPSHSLAGRIKLNKKQLKIKEDSNKNIRSNINISLDGINIFNFAINYVPIIIKKLCKKIKVRYCFLHQANKMIQESIEKQLSKNKMTFPTSLHNFGNTSSATIPITICHNFFNQRLVGNSIFCGFGVGLSMSAVIINIQKTKIFKIIKI